MPTIYDKSGKVIFQGGRVDLRGANLENADLENDHMLAIALLREWPREGAV